MRADEFKQIFPLGEKNDAYADFLWGSSNEWLEPVEEQEYAVLTL